MNHFESFNTIPCRWDFYKNNLSVFSMYALKTAPGNPGAPL